MPPRLSQPRGAHDSEAGRKRPAGDPGCAPRSTVGRRGVPHFPSARSAKVKPRSHFPPPEALKPVRVARAAAGPRRRRGGRRRLWRRSAVCDAGGRHPIRVGRPESGWLGSGPFVPRTKLTTAGSWKFRVGSRRAGGRNWTLRGPANRNGRAGRKWREPHHVLRLKTGTVTAGGRTDGGKCRQ